MLGFLLLLSASVTSITPSLGRHIIIPAGNDAAPAAHIDRPAQSGAHGSAFTQPHANLTNGPSDYPVHCFQPTGRVLDIVIAEDCEIVINEIILRLPNPMQKQTVGFNDSADINLKLRQNRNWHHKQCLMVVSSSDKTEQDSFRPIDIAVVAQRIINSCVVGSKDALGGASSIGSPSKNFFMVLGGVPPVLGLPTGTGLTLPPSIIPDRNISYGSVKDASERTISKRSSLDLLRSSSLFVPISCVKPGMPAAVKSLKFDDCAEAVKGILRDPKVLDLQDFTTEPSGGTQVPFIRQARGCFLQVNTHAHYSSSARFSLLKVAYYASEIIRKCALGGVAKLGSGGGFFVSVTGVDPSPKENGLEYLLNITTTRLGLGIY